MPTIPQKYRQAAVADLTPHPANPRQGDAGAIHTSIETNGFYGAIIVQKSTQRVLAGNHRLQALIQAGTKRVPIIEVDVDDATARRILLADNRTNDLASSDDGALLDVLKLMSEADDGLLGTGYDDDDLDALVRLSLAGAKPLDPTREWNGRPAYDQDDNNAIFSCRVHFRTPEHADPFFASIELPKQR